MRILMLTPYVPYPPASGGQIRTLNLLKYLSEEHEIILVALYKDEEQRSYANDLKKYCKKIYLCKRAKKPWQLNNILRAVFTRWPFLIVRNYSPQARQVVETILKEEDIDVIHAETFYVMPHVPKTHKPILLVDQTIEYKVYQHYIKTLPLPLELVLNLDIIKLKYWERFYWRKANVVALMSEKDEEIVRKLEPKVKTTIIPNGAGEDMLVKAPAKKDISSPTLLFVGNYSWLQNTEAAQKLAEEIFPVIKKKIPHIKLVIAGQHAEELLQYKSEDIIVHNISPSDNETVVRLYKECTLFIAPIFGEGGTRLKILAAMAAGMPVIGTSIALEGLEVEHKKHALIAQNSREFAEGVSALLHDASLFSAIQHNAHELVLKNYSFKAISKKLAGVYKSIV